MLSFDKESFDNIYMTLLSSDVYTPGTILIRHEKWDTLVIKVNWNLAINQIFLFLLPC